MPPAPPTSAARTAPPPNVAADVLEHISARADLIVPIGFGEPPTLLDAVEEHAGELDRVRSGGKAFLVLHGATSTGRNRIRVHLTSGSAVTTLKNTIDHVVTEYGVASLRGISLSERAHRLINIAHPERREQLRFDAREAGLLR